MAIATNMGRRALFQAIPAAVVMSACPLAALAGPQPTRIVHLFNQWQSIIDAASAYDPADESPDVDEKLERLFYRRSDAIREMILVEPCVGPADFAAKMIVTTDRGQWLPDFDAGTIWKEARALIGVSV